MTAIHGCVRVNYKIFPMTAMAGVAVSGALSQWTTPREAFQPFVLWSPGVLELVQSSVVCHLFRLQGTRWQPSVMKRSRQRTFLGKH